MNFGFQSASWMKVLWMDEGGGGGGRGCDECGCGRTNEMDVDESEMDAHRVVQAEGRRRRVALGLLAMVSG
jgi:hypothetical protein